MTIEKDINLENHSASSSKGLAHSENQTISVPFREIFRQHFSVITANPEKKSPIVLVKDIPSSVMSAALSFKNLSSLLKREDIQPDDKRDIIRTYKDELSRQIGKLEFPQAIPHVLQFIEVLYNTTFGYEILQKLEVPDFFDLTNPQIVIALMLKNSKKGVRDSDRRDILAEIVSEKFSGDDIESSVTQLLENIEKLPATVEECEAIKKAVAKSLVSMAVEVESLSLSDIYEDSECFSAVMSAILEHDSDLETEIWSELEGLRAWKAWFPAHVKSSTYIEKIIHNYLNDIQVSPQDIRLHTKAQLNAQLHEAFVGLPAPKLDKKADKIPSTSDKQSKKPIKEAPNEKVIDEWMKEDWMDECPISEDQEIYDDEEL